MRFKKGKLTGELRITQVEKQDTRRGYYWADCLALLDDSGNWLYTEHWRTNGHKTAEKTLLDIGWKRA